MDGGAGNNLMRVNMNGGDNTAGAGTALIEQQAGETDERRRDWRETVERMLRLAMHLPKADRALVVGAYERGMTAADLGRVCGATSKVVRGRLQRIVLRMSSAEFRYTVREQYGWAELKRRICQEVFLKGATQRETARGLGISVHRVRREVDEVRIGAGLENR